MSALSLSLSLFWALISGLAQAGFRPIAESNGVQVFSHDGKDIELGAEADIDAPPTAVRRLLLDYSNHPKWVKGLVESRILATTPSTLDVYQRLDLPVLADRDYTLHVTWGAEGDRMWLQFAAVKSGGPPTVKNVVRVHVNDGSWLLTPINGGRGTHAVYRFRLDLGGSLPGWMGKGRAAKDVPHLIENIRQQARYYR